MSKDPIGEEGGVNLYGFVGNDGVNKWDLIGKFYPGRLYGEYLPFLPTYGTSGADNITDTVQWNTGKWVAQTAGYDLTLAAMNHADGTIRGDWVLNAAENALAKAQTESHAHQKSTGKSFKQWLKDELYNGFHTRSSGRYLWEGIKDDFHYTKGFDGYTAFGDASLGVSGDVTVCQGWITTTVSLPLGTVDLSDWFTFSGYAKLGLSNRITPTAVGYRLEDSGRIHPFATAGTWKTDESFTFFRF